MHKDNKLTGNTLFFSNKTAADIICEKELLDIMGDKAVFILTKENNPKYKSGKIDEPFIKDQISDFHKHFYICGPDAMITEISSILENLGAETDSVVFEK